MIKDLRIIASLMSECIYLDHPIILDIRWWFTTTLCPLLGVQRRLSRGEWQQNITKYNKYTLKDFVRTILKNGYFRESIISVLTYEREKLLRGAMMQDGKDLEIHYARYGSVAHKRDVIEIIQKQMSSYDRLNLLVDNDNLGGDFYSGKGKQLHIIYTFNGVLCEEKLDEGEVLVIPKITKTEIINIMPDNALVKNINIGLAVIVLVLGIGLIVKDLYLHND